MKYTTKEVAEILNKSDRTITNYIKDGKLSAERDDNGNYKIDASELYIRFPNAKKSEEISGNFSEENAEISQKIEENPYVKIKLLELENKHLNEKIKDLEEQLKEKNNHLESKRKESEKILDTFGNMQKLLEHESTKKSKIWDFFKK